MPDTLGANTALIMHKVSINVKKAAFQNLLSDDNIFI